MSIASDTPYQSGEDMGENETESVMGKNDRKGQCSCYRKFRCG